MPHINDVTDYVISRLVDGGARLNQLKLQKLLYYVQAWHLANYARTMFCGRFEAWVHGPVSRDVFDRFRDTKRLYSPMMREDIRGTFNSEAAIPAAERAFIDAVLDVYAPLTGDQLEALTHREDPWTMAREGLAPDDRCDTEIDEELMRTYYASRLT